MADVCVKIKIGKLGQREHERQKTLNLRSPGVFEAAYQCAAGMTSDDEWFQIFPVDANQINEFYA